MSYDKKRDRQREDSQNHRRGSNTGLRRTSGSSQPMATPRPDDRSQTASPDTSSHYGTDTGPGSEMSSNHGDREHGDGQGRQAHVMADVLDEEPMSYGSPPSEHGTQMSQHGSAGSHDSVDFARRAEDARNRAAVHRHHHYSDRRQSGTLADLTRRHEMSIMGFNSQQNMGGYPDGSNFDRDLEDDGSSKP